jgi:hypothetical protein
MLSRSFEPLADISKGDAATRRALGMNPNERVADFVGYNARMGRWLIAESKASHIHRAVTQLESTMNALLKQTGFTSADVNLRIYTDATRYGQLLSPDGLGGYIVRHGHLHRLATGSAPILVKINQVVVQVMQVP